MRKLLTIFFLGIMTIVAFAKEKMVVGVTLQPYYSYVSNVVGDKMDVIPIIRGDLFDSHNYQAKYEDIENVSKVNIIVVNGIGHDEFIFPIIDASPNKDNIKIIYANNGVSLMPVSGTRHSEKIMNPHTFISITAAIQQVYNIAKELGELDPENKSFYLKNAREYARRLRKLKTDALSEVVGLSNLDFRVATLHGGYDYMLSEFGIEVKAVIEPAHGVQPSASDLKEIIDIINKEKIDVIFGEKNFSNKFIETVKKETGVEIRSLSHLTHGAYTSEGFELFIKENLDSIVESMKDTALKKGIN